MGGCSNLLVDGYCRIGGKCWADGQGNPDNPCLACSVSKSVTAWSPVEDATACGPGSCTDLTFTSAKTCLSGACTGGGGVQDCDDAHGCTADSCAASGCANALLAGSCLIAGHGCAQEWQGDPADPCRICAPGFNGTAWTPAAYEPVAAFDASHAPGIVCGVGSALKQDGQSCGLDQVSSLGYGTIDGQKVGGCVGLDFGATRPAAQVVVRAARANMACVAACGKDPTSGESWCGTDPGSKLFVGETMDSLSFSGSIGVDHDFFQDYRVSVMVLARFVVVCRGAGSHKRDDILVDAVSLSSLGCAQ
jgi:hypothetical protein